MRLVRGSPVSWLSWSWRRPVGGGDLTIRTAPLGPLTGGHARCAAVNGGTQAGSVTLTLFSDTRCGRSRGRVGNR